MTVSLAILWIIVGFASVLKVFPWWWEPYPPEGKPQPVPWKPQPNPWMPWLIGAAGGFMGGWVFTSVWALPETVTVVDAAATAVGSLLGARLLLNIYSLIRSRPSSTSAR
jgi:hypothetical protein